MSTERERFEAWFLTINPDSENWEHLKYITRRQGFLIWQAALASKADSVETEQSVRVETVGRGGEIYEYTKPEQSEPKWKPCSACEGRGQRYNSYSMTECAECCGSGAMLDEKILELELNRADYQAIRAAGFDSPAELLAAYQRLMKQAPCAWVCPVDEGDGPDLTTNKEYAEHPMHKGKSAPLFAAPQPDNRDKLVLLEAAQWMDVMAQNHKYDREYKRAKLWEERAARLREAVK